MIQMLYRLLLYEVGSHSISFNNKDGDDDSFIYHIQCEALDSGHDLN